MSFLKVTFSKTSDGICTQWSTFSSTTVERGKSYYNKGKDSVEGWTDILTWSTGGGGRNRGLESRTAKQNVPVLRVTRVWESKDDITREVLCCQEKGKMRKVEQPIRLWKQKTIFRRHLSGSFGIQFPIWFTLHWYLAKTCSHHICLIFPWFWYLVLGGLHRLVCAKDQFWPSVQSIH